MSSFRRLLAACLAMSTALHAEPLSLTLRSHGELARSLETVKWEPSKTAIIVCDMWDSHHSVTAVRRVNEMAPRLNAVLEAARKRGVTIIHSPSDCMPAYKNHHARKRALAVPAAKDPPPDIAAWCHRIPSEEKAVYPIDQSDGGEDESKWENDQWDKRLKADGRNPGTPWLRQNELLEIVDFDYIAAEGDIVWNILQEQGIEHVILSGVHTNMCVLGRPFGLRQMVRAGMDTVLLRDCTDVMYNPERWPYVSHFTGLDLVIEHIERFVCPTISSDQLIGGEAFRFKGDRRPTVGVIVKEAGSLPEVKRFTRRYLDPAFRVLYDFGKDGQSERGDSPPDLLLITGGGFLLGEHFGSKPVVYLRREDLQEGKWISGKGGRTAHIKEANYGKAEFDRELFEAICWAAEVAMPGELPQDPDRRRASEGWRRPGANVAEGAKFRDLRTLLRIPSELGEAERSLRWKERGEAKWFLNGELLKELGDARWDIPSEGLRPGDLNLLVCRLPGGVDADALKSPPEIVEGDSAFQLDCVHWQERFSSAETPDVGFPIPPQFGAPTDLIQNWVD